MIVSIMTALAWTVQAGDCCSKAKAACPAQAKTACSSQAKAGGASKAMACCPASKTTAKRKVNLDEKGATLLVSK